MTKIELLKGRVIANHYTRYIVENNNQIYSLELSGRFKYIVYSKSDYPVVGDYVFFAKTNQNDGIIEKLETRRNALSRLSTSEKFNEQIIASNLDMVFICVSLNEDFNIKKILNFLNITSNEYEKILLLTKKDLTEDIDRYIDEVKKYIDIPVLAVSLFDNADVSSLKQLLENKTGIFIGSSGVGKSSLINRMLNEDHLKTKEIRISDAQGRHTTTHKELFKLDNNGYIIDSPGIRIVNSYFNDNLDEEFDDILEIASQCKFRDCTHTNEPGCNVIESVTCGEISYQRFNQYQKVIKYNAYVKREEKKKILLQNKRKVV